METPKFITKEDMDYVAELRERRGDDHALGYLNDAIEQRIAELGYMEPARVEDVRKTISEMRDLLKEMTAEKKAGHLQPA